ncbi:MAG: response regulator [Arcobacteraceae bacterium]|nr:response regulator [Arcobacteraceae bacterium]
MILKNFTILYVEDSKVLREYMKNSLKPYVKEIYTANDGKEGLEQFVKIKPDIVITDINMPNIDGMQMSKMIKNSFKDTPIVLLTGFDEPENLKKAIMLGIDSFVSKPVKEEELIEILKSIALKLQNKMDAEKLKQMQLQQEKVNAFLILLKEIGHHWRQPLSAIMTIATSYELKKIGNCYNSIEEEINDINKIPEQITKLSNMLLAVEEIDFNKIKLEEIDKIIQISDPLY